MLKGLFALFMIEREHIVSFLALSWIDHQFDFLFILQFSAAHELKQSWPMDAHITLDDMNWDCG